MVIDDAIGLVRGTPASRTAAKPFIDFVGSDEAQLLAAREVFRLPARSDLPRGAVPAWVAEVERDDGGRRRGLGPARARGPGVDGLLGPARAQHGPKRRA